MTGARQFPSLEAPFQKFRWVHFPFEPKADLYTYRGTKMHMPTDGKVVPGTAIELQISLDPVTYKDFLDVGFTRNFASSQAYAERYKNRTDIIPASADDGLRFHKVDSDVYAWLGFEAYDLIFQFLQEAVDDHSIELNVFAYDLNEPDIVARLEQLGPRLRAIIDDSSSHGSAGSAESQAAKRLGASAGAERVRRTHFSNLQHNKVFIAKRGGKFSRSWPAPPTSASGGFISRRTTCWSSGRPRLLNSSGKRLRRGSRIPPPSRPLT